MLWGRDVSNYQGNYDWNSVISDFGFCKATEGNNYQDPYFPHNWNTMWHLQILRGAYHFGHPGTDPVAQAMYFITYVRQHGLLAGNALALDLEVNDGRSSSAVAAWAVKFCNEVLALTGRKNIYIYVNHSYITEGYCRGLYGFPLWVASYTTAGNPGSISPWSVWSIQQYTDTPIDMDVFNGDVTMWNKLAA